MNYIGNGRFAAAPNQLPPIPSNNAFPSSANWRVMIAHISSLFQDAAMLARMDMAFEALMRDTATMSSPTWYRNIGPKMKYNINFQCEDATGGVSVRGAIQRMVVLCTIILNEDPLRTLQFGLRSEMLIPGERIAVVDAMHVPTDIWDSMCSGEGDSKNFGKTAINFYKTYRGRYPTNFANSLVSTAYSSDGDASNGEAARALVKYLMSMTADDVGFDPANHTPKFEDMRLPQEVFREYSTTDEPDDADDEVSAPQYNLNDPRSLAEAMRNIQKK